MKKLVLYVLFFGVLGLITGYLIFGKFGGDYVHLKTIFSSSKSAIESFGRNISGIAKMKQNILVSGGIGGILGIIIATVRKK